jgi:hypothetical protein
MENKRFISATLADVYLDQGYIETSIEIYEKLAKKEPENNFYRQRISSLKKELKEKQKTPSLRRFLKKKLW